MDEPAYERRPITFAGTTGESGEWTPEPLDFSKVRWREAVLTDEATEQRIYVPLDHLNTSSRRVSVTARFYEPEQLDVDPDDLPEGWTTVEVLKDRGVRQPSEADIERVSRLIDEKCGVVYGTSMCGCGRRLPCRHCEE